MTVAAPESATVIITALAGPVCPVQTDPPLPNCGPLLVAGATIIVIDSLGQEVARGITDSSGILILTVSTGNLRIVPQRVPRFLGTAPEIEITVAAHQTLEIVADYDTGIR